MMGIKSGTDGWRGIIAKDFTFTNVEKVARAHALCLKERKNDLLERVETELNLNENSILEFSNLNQIENLPDTVTQEEELDEKKRKREKKIKR